MAVGEGGRGANNGIQELIKTTTALGSKTIDLSRKNLTEIPSEVLDLDHLEFLYLEGNYLTEIPHYLFEKLSSLKWLDLRNNRITEIPAAIGSHKALRNLLLEGNDIKELPLELGFAKLSGLNIASNPLEMPPSCIIEKGTQEVLRFLREKYASKMQMDEDQAASGLRPASQSSSEEDLNNNYEIAAQLPKEEKAPAWEDEVRVERVRLPPIFQAAAERPRNRTVDESNEILRGQKSTQFEPKPKVNVQISEPEIRIKSPQKQLRHDESRRSHSPPKKAILSSEDVGHKRTTFTKMKKYSDAALKGSSEAEQVQRMEERTEKPKKRRKSRSRSPTKSVNQATKSHEKNTSLNHESSSKNKEVIQVTFKTNQMTVSDNDTHPAIIDASQKQLYEPQSLVDEIRDMTKMPNNPVGVSLKEGDFVAIKVPSKLYIKGQPCLGKITTMEDNLGLLTVHYYTGSYEGYWRPMMSRTSPYLRKVPHQSVLCKFKLSGDGRMSPITRAKVKKVVDGAEQKQQ